MAGRKNREETPRRAERKLGRPTARQGETPSSARNRKPTMLLWRIVVRELRAHPGRALLTLLSVVIGVATVVAVNLATASSRQASQSMYRTITGDTALEVTAAGGGSFEQEVLEVVRQTPGVQAAVPLIQRPTILYYEGGRAKLLALGIDPQQDAAVREYRLVAGQRFPGGRGVMLDAALGRNLDLEVGSPVRLLTRRGLVRTSVVGLVEPQSGAAVSQGGMLFMPLASAQRRFASAGQVDRLQLILQEQADVDQVQAAIERRLPEGLGVHPPATNSPLAEETVLALENGLQLASAFALLSAVFIIANTFLMNVGQRRKTLSVMRALGATRRQVAGLLLREALLLAALGTGLGLLAGWGIAWLVGGALGQLMQTEIAPSSPSFRLLFLAAVFGFGVSLLGAYVPLRAAARLSPLEGMSGRGREDLEHVSRWVVLLGLGGLIAAAALLAAAIGGWLPIHVSVGSVVLGLISLVLLLPLALGPLSRLASLAMRPLLRVEARLARQQLLRHRGRTTLTVGVLFVAIGTAIGLGHAIVDNVRDVRTWYRSAIAGDFFVRATMPDMETAMSAAVPEEVGRAIEQIPGVTRVANLRMVSATANETGVIVVALGDQFRSGQAGPPPAIAEIPPGEVVIGSVLAQRSDLSPGDTLVLETRSGPRELRIAETVNDYLAGGLTVRMRRELAQQLLEIEGVDAFAVTVEPGQRAAAAKALGELCREHGLLLQSYAELVQLIEFMMAGVVGSLWALLALAVVVASFGVVNTLGMNVLEQTRELALLRVVAMTRWQVRKTIAAQALMLGLLGLVPGALAGLAVAYVTNLSTMYVTGHPIAFAAHGWLVAGGLAAALLLVVAAAWLPAERAARLELSAALRYE